MSTPLRRSIQQSEIAETLDRIEPAASPRPAGWIDRWLATRLQRAVSSAAVRLELWDGSSSYESATPPLGTLVIRDRGPLIGLALDPDLQFGESYMAGRLEVRGPLQPLVQALTG